MKRFNRHGKEVKVPESYSMEDYAIIEVQLPIRVAFRLKGFAMREGLEEEGIAAASIIVDALRNMEIERQENEGNH